MSDAERIGYRWAKWADAHPKSAKIIAGSIILCFGALMALLSWNYVTDKPAKAIPRFIAIGIGVCILMLIGYPKKIGKGHTLKDSSVNQSPL
jgi:tetrahydromethanopterin S-methyltransferase subunit E